MPTVALIPVKSFGLGNRRLSDALTADQRIRLAQALGHHVAATAETAGMIAVFVSDDPDVAGWAAGIGFPTVPDPGTGLDDAADAGVVWALESNSPWVVLHSDLPLLQPPDLALLTKSGGEAIAPSADGGTSAIAARRRVDFSFGPGSFHRHMPRLEEPTVVSTVGLLHDVDSPRDLHSAISHPRGNWLRGSLS